MTIAELKPKQGKVDLICTVIEKAESRQFAKFGQSGRVCSAKAKDETGEITLTLWNDQVDQVNVGDKIHITNGYVNEWQSQMQLTTGRFGKLEVLEKGPAEPKKKEEAPAVDEKADYTDEAEEDEPSEEFVDE